jgi:hypothetical protein
MMKRLPVINITEDQSLDMAMASWAFDSHNWIEERSGYYHCSWCDKFHTNIMGIRKDFPLCKKNPRLEGLFKKIGELFEKAKDV